MERDLPAGVAHLRPEVMPVEHLEPLAGQDAEPEEERNLRVLGELAGPPGEVDERFLENVGRVEPALQAAVEAEPDHPLEPLAVAVPEHHEGALIPGYPLPQEPDRVVRIVHDRRVHNPGTAKNRRRAPIFSNFLIDQFQPG